MPEIQHFPANPVIAGAMMKDRQLYRETAT